MRIGRIDYADWDEEVMLDEIVIENIGMVHLERTSRASAWIGVYDGKERLSLHSEVRPDGALDIWIETAPRQPQEETK